MVPYIRAKAQDYYESLGGGVDPSLFEDEPSSHAPEDADLVGPFQNLAYWTSLTSVVIADTM